MRFQLWVQVDTGSSLNTDTAMLCDIGQVHFFPMALSSPFVLSNG